MRAACYLSGDQRRVPLLHGKGTLVPILMHLCSSFETTAAAVTQQTTSESMGCTLLFCLKMPRKIKECTSCKICNKERKVEQKNVSSPVVHVPPNYVLEDQGTVLHGGSIVTRDNAFLYTSTNVHRRAILAEMLHRYLM